MRDTGGARNEHAGDRGTAPAWLVTGTDVCAVLRGPLSTPAVAERFARAGWSSRSSSWYGYEVETGWCQAELDPTEGSDTLLNGLVVPEELDTLASLLTGFGLSFTLESYDDEGTLLREIRSR